MTDDTDQIHVQCSVCHTPTTLIVNKGQSLESALDRLNQRAGWTVIDGEIICPKPHDHKEGISLRGAFWAFVLSIPLWLLIIGIVWLVTR
jgi:hypothetical protein